MKLNIESVRKAVALLRAAKPKRRHEPLTNTNLVAGEFPDFSTWTRQRARAAARWSVFVEIFKKHGRATDRSIQYAPEHTRRTRRHAARLAVNAMWRHIQPPHFDLTK